MAADDVKRSEVFSNGSNFTCCVSCAQRLLLGLIILKQDTVKIVKDKWKNLGDVKRSHGEKTDCFKKTPKKQQKPRALSFKVIFCQQPPSDSVYKMSNSEKQRIGPTADVTV